MRDDMIAESADIKFACPQCGQRIVVDKSAAGLHGTCPICEGPVTVPFLENAEHGLPDLGNGPYADPGLEETREELFGSAEQVGQLQRQLDQARSEIERQHALFKKAVDEC